MAKCTPSEKLKRIKSSASSRGKECTLTVEDMEHLMSFKNCAYTGDRFDWEADPSDANSNAFSIERIDEDRGYVADNVIPVTRKANNVKNLFMDHNGGVAGKTSKHSKDLVTTALKVQKALDTIEEWRHKYYKDSATQTAYKETKPMTQEKENSSVIYVPANPEIQTARCYSDFGTFIEDTCQSEFLLTYSEFSRKLKRKKCALTGREIKKAGFFVPNKTLPVDKKNLMIVDSQIQEVLDTMIASAKLSFNELKLLCKTLSK